MYYDSELVLLLERKVYEDPQNCGSCLDCAANDVIITTGVDVKEQYAV